MKRTEIDYEERKTDSGCDCQWLEILKGRS